MRNLPCPDPLIIHTGMPISPCVRGNFPGSWEGQSHLTGVLDEESDLPGERRWIGHCSCELLTIMKSELLPVGISRLVQRIVLRQPGRSRFLHCVCCCYQECLMVNGAMHARSVLHACTSPCRKDHQLNQSYVHHTCR